MKKAKMFLSAIAVFAVVGSALAFKANYQGPLLCNTPQQGSGICVSQTAHFALNQTNGTNMFCNSGVPGDINCVNNVKVIANQ